MVVRVTFQDIIKRILKSRVTVLYHYLFSGNCMILLVEKHYKILKIFDIVENLIEGMIGEQFLRLNNNRLFYHFRLKRSWLQRNCKGKFRRTRTS